MAAGDFVEHARYAGHRYGTLRSELERRTARRRARSCSRSRSRARARSARPCPTPSRSSSRRPRWTPCARGWWAGGPTTPPRWSARLRTAERELEAQGEFRHVVVNDRLEDATEALADIVERALQAP